MNKLYFAVLVSLLPAFAAAHEGPAYTQASALAASVADAPAVYDGGRAGAASFVRGSYGAGPLHLERGASGPGRKGSEAVDQSPSGNRGGLRDLITDPSDRWAVAVLAAFLLACLIAVPFMTAAVPYAGFGAFLLAWAVGTPVIGAVLTRVANGKRSGAPRQVEGR